MNYKKMAPALRFLALTFLLSALLAGCGAPASSSGAAGGGERPPPGVSLHTVALAPVEIHADFTGRVRGARELEVRAQVGGILEARLFVEGQAIEAGTPMFRIERAPYEIALRRAEADLADARANLSQSQREWRRISGLFEQNATSERERDRALSQYELAQAGFAQREAGVAQAQLNLAYTDVNAPLTGITGLETLPEGSLVERGTLLATLTQRDPVHVLFSLPQNDAIAQRILSRVSADSGEGEPFEATMLLADGSTYPLAGAVDFTSPSVDPRTGTTSARAVFPNPEAQVRPGQFVRVRVLGDRLAEAARIPAVAVVQGSDGPAVYVVDEESVARLRAVTLGPVVAGEQIVIDGLVDGDRVVVNGQVALRDGAAVTVRNGQQGAN